MTKPLVSVVMPVYNGETYFQQAMESLLSQTFRDFECVLVNDGSTDRSMEIARSYHDDRIVIHETKHLGLVSALNTGVKLARSDLIARMDCDDIAFSERLEKQYQFMTRYPHIDVLGTAFSVVNESEQHLRELYPPCEDELIRQFAAVRSQISHPTVMYRKKAVVQHGGYRDIVPEDCDLFMRMLLSCRMANLPTVTMRIRSHENNFTSKHTPQSELFYRQKRAELLSAYRSLTIPYQGSDVHHRREEGLCQGNMTRCCSYHGNWNALMHMEIAYLYMCAGYPWKARNELGRVLRYARFDRQVIQFLFLSLLPQSRIPYFRSCYKQMADLFMSI